MLMLYWNGSPEELVFFPALPLWTFMTSLPRSYNRLSFFCLRRKAEGEKENTSCSAAECRHSCKIFLNSISIFLHLNLSSAPFFYYFYLWLLIHVMGCGPYIRFSWSFSTPLPRVAGINQTPKWPNKIIKIFPWGTLQHVLCYFAVRNLRRLNHFCMSHQLIFRKFGRPQMANWL